MDEEDGRVEVVVPDEQLSLAIGRRGQNVRLASQLTGWQIDIITESQDSERRQREFAERTQLFQEALDVDEVIAQLLVTEGFATVEDVAYVEPSEIAAIEGFDEDTAEEIQARARDYLDKEAAEYDAKRRELGVEDGVLEIEGVTLPMAVALGEKRREDAGRPRRPGARRHPRLLREQGRRAGARARHPRRLQPLARGRRGADHAGPRRRRLDRAGSAEIEEELVEEELAEEDEALGEADAGGRGRCSKRRRATPEPRHRRPASGATSSPAR